MGQALLSSKIIVEEEQPSIVAIEGVPTSIVAALGITERGPIGVPTLVTSFDEFRAIFGGFTADSDLALAVDGFFANEGQFMYVVRTVHYTDITNPATQTAVKGSVTIQTAASAPTGGTILSSIVGPYDLEPGLTLLVAVDGNPADTATFNATAASRTSGNTETFDLANGLTLTVAVDGGGVQTIDFLTAEFVDIANATAAEVAAVINAKITGAQATVSAGAVVITSDTRGTGSSIDVTGGTANSGGVNRLNFTTGAIAGTGNVANIDAVTVAEIKTVVEAAAVSGSGVTVVNEGGAVRITSNTTGASSSIQIEAASTADDEIGFDNAVHAGGTGAAVDTLRVDGKYFGAYTDGIQVVIESATSGVADEFNLTVLDDGLIVRTYGNLSMVDTSARFPETVLNAGGTEESELIAVVDLDAATPTQRPANGTYSLVGGDDGLVGLADTDFIGTQAGGTGLRAFDTIEDAAILIVPGQATAAIHNAMVNYCEITRNGRLFPILGSPAGLTASQVVTYFETTAGLVGLSEFGAAYWPRPKILNPNKTIFGNDAEIVVPAEGIIAGVYARVDASKPGGVFEPPAGETVSRLIGVVGFETTEVDDENKRDLVFPKRINILRGRGAKYIDGSRVLKANGNFPYVHQRRGTIFIAESLRQGTEFARHRRRNDKLRRVVSKSWRAFLNVQTSNEAFASEDPNLAYFVDVGKKLNPASKPNILTGRVGLAYDDPAEYVIIKISRDLRELETELANA